VRVSRGPFLQLQNHQNKTLKDNERKELKEGGLLQVHERQRQIQLPLLPHFCVLPNDKLQLARLSTTFCSSIFTGQFAQYYKIVMMGWPIWAGEVVKMCANVSYVMMTLNRTTCWSGETTRDLTSHNRQARTQVGY
jgi:hypothetical protein